MYLDLISVTFPSVLTLRQPSNRLMHLLKKRLAFSCILVYALSPIAASRNSSTIICQLAGHLLCRPCRSSLSCSLHHTCCKRREMYDTRTVSTLHSPISAWTESSVAAVAEPPKPSIGKVQSKDQGCPDPKTKETDGKGPSKGAAAELNQHAGLLGPNSAVSAVSHAERPSLGVPTACPQQAKSQASWV